MFKTALAALPRFALFLLALLPVMIGGLILVSMQFGLANDFNLPTDIQRRESYPVSIVAHILGGSAMLVLGFAQFSTRLRRRFPGLHRWVGRGLVAAGIAFSLTGLVMNASSKAQADSLLYNSAQNVMAVVFLTVLFLGIRAIRQGRIAAHRAWMMRSYAITLGAATQTLLILPVFLITGQAKGLVIDLVFILAWVVNLSVAELVIRGTYRRNGSAMTAPNRS